MSRLAPKWLAIVAAFFAVRTPLAIAQAPPADVAQAEIVSLAVSPTAVRLEGPRASWRLLVEGVLADGRTVDLTRDATFSVAPDGPLAVDPRGIVSGKADGRGELRIEAAGKSLVVPVAVADFDSPRLLNFENDVIPLLSRYGCNASGCHGKAEGQNGFKLSVFGFDPRADYDALSKQDRGRRVFPAAAPRSLLLRKASGGAPHGGGVRFSTANAAYGVLADWIAGGLRFGGADDPKVVSIQVLPRERQLDPRASGLGGRQQLRVEAIYSDGRVVDVTSLARFQSNDDSVASVDEHGLVASAGAPGQAAIMATFMGCVDVFQAIAPKARSTNEPAPFAEYNLADKFVNARLRKLNIEPSGEADDAEFLRRLYLDVIGTLPTADEVRARLADVRPERRARWLEELFERPEYADYWALKWADLLRVDRAALGHKGAHSYYRWIRENFAQHRPFDAFARDVLTAEGPANENPATNFYAANPSPGGAASVVSQVFLGVRIACAECHHHPFDRWGQDDYYGMQAFFAPLARKPTPSGAALVAQGEPATRHPRTGAAIFAHALGEPAPERDPPGDRRRVLAEWVTAPNNPFFARNIANRTWAHFMGRGLIEPVDDLRLTNPPSNPELLDALAAHFVDNHFDMRALVRLIVGSAAYQRSSTPSASNADDEQNYSRFPLKRLDAEVVLDAISQTTGVPEKFFGLPSGYRALQLWDSQTPHYFLRLFGRPTRQSACECERNVEASVAQVLHFMNSPTIEAKLEHVSGRIAMLESRLASDEALAEELYLTFFSRRPAPDEATRAVQYLAERHDRRRQAAVDLAWSMLNSLEFIFNH